MPADPMTAVPMPADSMLSRDATVAQFDKATADIKADSDADDIHP